MARIVIIGGGPAGYEAALVAAQLGADGDGRGGRRGRRCAGVLFDCVPSKTFIASSDVVTAFHHGGSWDPVDTRRTGRVRRGGGDDR
jgi:dihydrolipoamide dehydrogenase